MSKERVAKLSLQMLSKLFLLCVFDEASSNTERAFKDRTKLVGRLVLSVRAITTSPERLWFSRGGVLSLSTYYYAIQSLLRTFQVLKDTQSLH